MARVQADSETKPEQHNVFEDYFYSIKFRAKYRNLEFGTQSEGKQKQQPNSSLCNGFPKGMEILLRGLSSGQILLCACKKRPGGLRNRSGPLTCMLVGIIGPLCCCVREIDGPLFIRCLLCADSMLGSLTAMGLLPSLFRNFILLSPVETGRCVVI